MRRIPAGSIVLTPTDARILYQVARLRELRQHYRIGNSAVYELLTEITKAALLDPTSDNGSLARQDAETGERETWTVRQIATAVGLSDRTVRNDCKAGDLPATRQGNTWTVTAVDAQTYIHGRRRR